MTESQQIARTILDQLGRQFIALTGSSHFVALESGLQFNVGSGAKDGIGKVRIILEPSLRTRESPRDALQRLAREYVAAYLNR
jgi:hypothetical protein